MVWIVLYIRDLPHAVLLFAVSVELLGLLFHRLLDHLYLLHLIRDLLLLVLDLLEIGLKLLLLILELRPLLGELRDDVTSRDLEFEQLFVLVIDVRHVLLVLDLELVEVDELEVVAGFVLLADLLLGLNDLRFECFDLGCILLNHDILLPELILPVLDNLLRLDLPSAGILSIDQDLAMEVKSVLTDFLDGHVRLIKNGLGHENIGGDSGTRRVSRIESDLIFPSSMFFLRASLSKFAMSYFSSFVSFLFKIFCFFLIALLFLPHWVSLSAPSFSSFRLIYDSKRRFSLLIYSISL